MRVDKGATLDAYAVRVGNQHIDYKQRVAQWGGQCYSNRVDILGGSTLYATNHQTIVGMIAPYFGNVLSVSGAGTKAKFGKGDFAVFVGQAGSCSKDLSSASGVISISSQSSVAVMVSVYGSCLRKANSPIKAPGP